MVGEILISVLIGVIGPIIVFYGTSIFIAMIGQLLKDHLEKGLYTNSKIFIILFNIIVLFVLLINWIGNDNGTLNIVLLVITWAISSYVVIRKLSKTDD